VSYRVEIQERAGGPWVPNGIRFETEAEAEYAKVDLGGRWFAPHAFRTAECDLPANYRWADGKGERLEVLS